MILFKITLTDPNGLKVSLTISHRMVPVCQAGQLDVLYQSKSKRQKIFYSWVRFFFLDGACVFLLSLDKSFLCVLGSTHTTYEDLRNREYLNVAKILRFKRCSSLYEHFESVSQV